MSMTIRAKTNRALLLVKAAKSSHDLEVQTEEAAMPATEESIARARAARERNDWHQVETFARQALLDAPGHADALCLLAQAHVARGDGAEAIRLYEQSIHNNPGFLDAYLPLAAAYYAFNRLDALTSLYRDWIKLEPENEMVQHMLAATTGDSVPARCSVGYVVSVFNAFAAEFDDLLLRNLAYQGPQIVARMLRRHAGSPCAALDVLDAGCGTGLCGKAVRPYCGTLVGVDLSEQMVEKARARQCYDELVISELCTFMRARLGAFDIVVSSDVLIYFGALGGVMDAATCALRQGGLLLVTLEALSGAGAEPYRLQASGRYCHRAGYVRELAQQAGFRILALDETVLRLERGHKVASYSIVARKA